ncbi:hypothetical protein [Methylosinus sp. Ce-a6]|uniref:hypothetical protein n=1 Tax=Methylosinus sp. Ce-a6 TaxID=2172005 RepID=UPI001FCE9FA0|nr:hypothetical protein [Methylosinus sp. Ce-a6]
MFPITSKQPTAGRFAVQVPEIEKRRAGLDADLPLWIILDEFNEDAIGRSFYLEPEPSLGRFSRAFFLPPIEEIHRATREHSRRQALRLTASGARRFICSQTKRKNPGCVLRT